MQGGCVAQAAVGLRCPATHSSLPKRLARSVLERALHQMTAGLSRKGQMM